MYGEIPVQGSKNAALPLMAAALLFPGVTRLSHCPAIRDVELMKTLLRSLGCEIKETPESLEIDAGHLQSSCLKREYMEGMRSSIILLGALLSRNKEADLFYPGGCVIGKRPIDYHLMALRKMGADIEISEERIHATTRGLKGARIHFPTPSVGATENTLLAAALAEGVTIIENAAMEPEVISLCNFLVKGGIAIRGIGTRKLKIKGGSLSEISYEVPSDRIVAGTYLYVAAGCGGDIVLPRSPVHELDAVISSLRQMGVKVLTYQNTIEIIATGRCNSIEYLKTGTYPGFATDLQPQLSAVLTCAQGNSIIEESIFEHRFGYVPELNSMGAKAKVRDRMLFLEGVDVLYGKNVEAKDLRGGAALVIAGLMADGTTRVNRCEFIERGYENIVRDLALAGAQIEYEERRQDELERLQ